MNYPPHPSFVFVLFALLLGALMLVLRFMFAGAAFRRLGIGRRAAFTLLWLSLLGSNINIPVAQLHAEHLEQDVAVSDFGMVYLVPRIVDAGRTVVAVNVGGAVIPVLLCAYLMIRYGIGLRLLIAIALVTVVANQVAHPVRGVGIAMPPWVAAAGAALAALLLDRFHAPRVAFIAGTLGTLIGADLLNLGKFSATSAPIVSIGGAGTFDGVFVTGIVAVLLAGIGGGRIQPQEQPH